MVLLIGNYLLDQQQSMQRFSAMMLEGLAAAGIQAELIEPEPTLGGLKFLGRLAQKWLGYIDKLILFPRQLHRALMRGPALVHICDHSNAVYAGQVKRVPVLVTCHDLLAVRGALGEQTDCPASWTGTFLQRWILKSLRRAKVIACVSQATLTDAQRLLDGGREAPRLELVRNGLNYPYRKLRREDAWALLGKMNGLDPDTPFVLHVGSNLRRKNRDGVLRIFARGKEQWNGQLVLAGDALTPELDSLGKELGIESRIVGIANPDSQLLEALYNCALTLLYPSRFEGFGWPIIEAQACGCPVICSNAGPLPEVAGDAALTHDVEDESGFAADVLRLLDPRERAIWSEKSLRNAERFGAEKMIAQYVEIYRSLSPQL
ncbi:MAG: glycosyltransferase family 1 protein [Verrucomicrobiota bacterium]